MTPWILFGLASLAFGAYFFFSKKGAEEGRGLKGQSQSEFESDVIFGRYFYSPRPFFGGLVILGFAIPLLFGINPNSIWVGAPYLALGIFFAVAGFLLLFSKKFADFYWRKIWHYDRNKERSYAAGNLFMLSGGMLLCAYLFSGVALYWP